MQRLLDKNQVDSRNQLLADSSSLLILSSNYYNCDKELSGAQSLKTDALEKYNWPVNTQVDLGSGLCEYLQVLMRI